ncbi:MAG: GTP-binding protein [Promethearchaeota archaeon]|nr:MAG: GTP-binding protein [Candidatus Lokiarchaeota archaeon]
MKNQDQKNNSYSRKLLFKVCIVGDGGVGKTTMVKRLLTGRYIEQKITIGTDLAKYTMNVGDNKIILQLWDFAGEKRFRFFLPNYSRGAKAVLLCYDIARRSTFNNLKEWYKIIDQNSNPVFLLVGTKRDLADEKRVISREDAMEFQEKYDINLSYETSSKTGHNINKVFADLTNEVLKKKEIEL